MRKIILLLLGIFLISFATSEVVITQQPNELYNLGDTINFPVKVVSLTDINALLTIHLICNGIESEVYKEYVFLSAGEEKSREPSIPLIMSFIGRPTGTCKIKAVFGEELQLTDDFKISDLIKVALSSGKTEFAPEEEIAIEIDAKKENDKPVEGFVEAMVSSEALSDNIEILDTVTNGYAYINFAMPKETKAGQYLIKINVTEKDSRGDTTNKGYANQPITITQVPTSLEVLIENQTIKPGNSVSIKAILHDQTGEKIESSATITIKNSEGIILEKSEKQTSELFIYPILYKEKPAEWTVLAESSGFTSEATFEIEEKAEVKTEIINKTLFVTNMGNVIYNDSLLVKIGNDSVSLNLNLEIDETKKYIISAPDGNYQIEIIDPEGESQTINDVALTGKSIGIKEAAGNVVTLARYPIVWFFIIAILGFIAFMFFKKGYKRSFFGYIYPRKKQESKIIPLGKSSIITPKNKAELSLSLKGDKQNISVICLKVKNLKEIKTNKEGAKETLQKVANIAEENKAFIYGNQENIFFLFAPAITKTFGNEKNAIKIAQAIREIFENHNKLFKQRIDYGLSLNYGTIVAKQEKDILKFMSMGTLITTAKKISSISKGEILLSEKIKDKLASSVKTQKQEEENTTYYKIKEIKNPEEHKKFIRSFLDRLEGKKG